MKTWIITAMFGGALLASGCGKKKNSQEGMDPGVGSSAMGSSTGSAPMAAGSGSAVAPATGSGSAAAAAAVDVPTEADFEADAKAKITDKNVDTELTTLEKDLAH